MFTLICTFNAPNFDTSEEGGQAAPGAELQGDKGAHQQEAHPHTCFPNFCVNISVFIDKKTITKAKFLNKKKKKQ